MKQNITRKEMRTALAWMQKVQRKAAFHPGIDVDVRFQYTKGNDRKGTNDAWSIELSVWEDAKDGTDTGHWTSFSCNGYLDPDCWEDAKAKATEFLEKLGVNVK